MARPKQDVVRDIEIKTRLSKDEYEQIKNMADHLEIPVSTFMRNLILASFEDAKMMESIKLLSGMKKFKEWKDALSVGAGQAQRKIKNA
jgi:hypothetical protein